MWDNRCFKSLSNRIKNNDTMICSKPPLVLWVNVNTCNLSTSRQSEILPFPIGFSDSYSSFFVQSHPKALGLIFPKQIYVFYSIRKNNMMFLFVYISCTGRCCKPYLTVRSFEHGINGDCVFAGEVFKTLLFIVVSVESGRSSYPKIV